MGNCHATLTQVHRINAEQRHKWQTYKSGRNRRRRPATYRERVIFGFAATESEARQLILLEEWKRANNYSDNSRAAGEAPSTKEIATQTEQFVSTGSVIDIGSALTNMESKGIRASQLFLNVEAASASAVRPPTPQTPASREMTPDSPRSTHITWTWNEPAELSEEIGRRLSSMDNFSKPGDTVSRESESGYLWEPTESFGDAFKNIDIAELSSSSEDSVETVGSEHNFAKKSSRSRQFSEMTLGVELATIALPKPRETPVFTLPKIAQRNLVNAFKL